ncbi:DUF1416 domain-containing protein [Streptomyces chiangmaiensis]
MTSPKAPGRGRRTTADRNTLGSRYHHPDRRGRAGPGRRRVGHESLGPSARRGGEFVGEVATSPSGEFRFDVLPGHWVLRALSPLGVTEMPVEAEPGRTVQAELRLCERLPERLEIIQISTLSLGNRSYLITDGTVAVAVDPQRDVERIVSVLDSRDLRLDTVVETHLHNDYVTGGLELSRRFRARYVVPAGPRLAFDAVRVADDDRLSAGSCGSG